MMPVVKILGIDPGSRMTGFGVVSVRGHALECLGFGAIEGTPRGCPSDFPSRLVRIYSGLRSVLKEYSPHVVAVEEVFSHVNARSALKLGHARGVALLAAAEWGLPVREYSPLEVKKSVVGYGRADKGQIQMMVRTLLRLKETPQPHDAADALAIAICHSLNGASDRRKRGRWSAAQVGR